MQRYDFTLPPGYEQNWYFDEGDFVLHSDAQAEIAAAEQRGRQEERAAIVAWLRGSIDDRRWTPEAYAAVIARANKVECGDHHAHGHKEG